MNGGTLNRSWAADSLSGDASQILETLERGFPVRLISTYDPITCDADEHVPQVMGDERRSFFDHLPVRENGRIIGLFDRLEFSDVNEDASSATVRSLMRPLDERILISADDSILAFVEDAKESPCRLVLDRREIKGIVTISDLQQLPVRPILFLLITHVELLMARLIRDAGFSEAQWLDLLSNQRREHIEDNWKQSHEANLEIDKLTATEFCDKRDIIRKSGAFDISKGRFDKDMKKIGWLRHAIAHASDYGTTRENAIKTIEAVIACRHWIDRLGSLMANAGGDSRQGAASG